MKVKYFALLTHLINFLDSLLKYFSTFGQINALNIVRGKKKKISKGFAFITCNDYKTLNRIIDHHQHVIGDRVVDVNYACGEDYVPLSVINMKRRKVYIKNLPVEVTEGKSIHIITAFKIILNTNYLYFNLKFFLDVLVLYFSKYGILLKAFVIVDHKTG